MKREGEPCVKRKKKRGKTTKPKGGPREKKKKKKKRKDDPNEINKTEDSLSGLQSRIDLLRCLKHLSARQDLKAPNKMIWQHQGFPSGNDYIWT